VSTATLVILVVIGLAVVALAVKLIAKGKAKKPELPLQAPGILVVRYPLLEMPRSQAERIANELAAIRVAVIAQCRRVYKRPCTAVIESLTLNPKYHKPAEWTGIVAGRLTVNPTSSKHRSHFAEEIHNKCRSEAFGLDNIYDPINQQDKWNREAIQQFCRDFK
jgi:hypothetical protein